MTNQSDFKLNIESASELHQLHELAEANYQVTVITARYDELQNQLEKMTRKADVWRDKAIESTIAAKSYKVMIDLVKTEPVLQEQFDTLLTTMKLMFPDIEDRMRFTREDLPNE